MSLSHTRRNLLGKFEKWSREMLRWQRYKGREEHELDGRFEG
jgi:hypothetical protein